MTGKVIKYIASAIGRRKSSVARVYLKEGSGNIVVNRRGLNDFFPQGTSRYVVKQPLSLLELGDKYDLLINVSGGGITGQSNAIRLGIARVLELVNKDFRSPLKKAGFLTRDARKVERKKYGRRGARRSFQFSKR